MKLHEYQAKELLQKRGVLTLPSRVCFTLYEVKQGLSEIGVPCVIKAQVHAGGRGKAGGIKLAKDETEALKLAETILSMKISTAQTGGRSLPVSSILIEGLASIKQELYFGMVIDRTTATICLMASRDGGTDIEEVAAKNPDSIKTVLVHKSQGLLPYQIRKLALMLDIKPALKKQFMTTMLGMYRTFVECDASLIEINPLIISDDDRIIALDAKMLIDDNALFRQPSISELRDSSQEDEKEVMAERHSLSYVALDGNIGCMVNGAGLAMATMDVIKHVGGNPANFLDVGGSATSERVEEALRIIVSDKKVKAIFVNVFGGIAKCDVIADGVVKAAKSLNLKLPLIVRLQGTNVELGRNILDKSGLSIIAANNLLEGAQMAVAKAS
jgi:succinyl-CoA synthetase beta subunit